MSRFLALALAVILAGLAPSSRAYADEDWVVRSFDASIEITGEGELRISEDIEVEFAGRTRHGIIRDIPVLYDYNRDYKREIKISVLAVDDGSQAIRHEVSRANGTLSIKIGDPDRFVRGLQRYRISYVVIGALNQPDGRPELFWNVTGNDWPVAIDAAGAVVAAPGIEQVACFQGASGSRDPCSTREIALPPRDVYRFVSSRPLLANEGLTVVVGLDPASVSVPPSYLVEIRSVPEQVADALGLTPLKASLAFLAGFLALAVVLRYWWLNGRDLWLGDVHYLTGATAETPRPLFAHDTVVVEYTPPEVNRRERRLRPAEIGLLLDERADTLDVSATIVDLAVRGYLRITEEPKQWLFGSNDYWFERLKDDYGGLRYYERRLLTGLFEDGPQVLMSSLKNKFYEDLKAVKNALYEDLSRELKYFAGNPESARSRHAVAGLLLTVLGVISALALSRVDAGVFGAPLILAGVALLALSNAMPRRTGGGREMFRRCLGFREYMEVAETDRQRFSEEANIFSEYLPYAVVFGCTEKWASAFANLDNPPDTSSWYIGSRPFAAVDLASGINSFSTAIGQAMSSTPGGAGGSGFSGGFSGSGLGGGGGRAW